ncbi:hypothetical protein BDV3_005984 [Batrachochytrium dendrobatidis]|nr:hypothetical protein QVD99_8735 [Batrachochytrium dendrobatidis]
MKVSAFFLALSSLCLMVSAMPVDPNGDVSNVQENDGSSGVGSSGVTEQHSNQKSIDEQPGPSDAKLSKSQKRKQKKERKRNEKLRKSREKMDEEMRREQSKYNKEQLEEDEKLRRKRQKLEERQRRRENDD